MTPPRDPAETGGHAVPGPAALAGRLVREGLHRPPVSFVSITESGRGELVTGHDMSGREGPGAHAAIVAWATPLFAAPPLLRLWSVSFEFPAVRRRRGAPETPTAPPEPLDAAAAFRRLEDALLLALVDPALPLRTAPHDARLVLRVTDRPGDAVGLFVQPERSGRSPGTEVTLTGAGRPAREIRAALGGWLRGVSATSLSGVLGEPSAHGRLAVATRLAEARRAAADGEAPEPGETP